MTHSTIAPGAVNSQTVSVLVDKSVPASAIPAIKSAVAGAVGLSAKRGDTLSISQIAFAKPATIKASPTSPSKMLGYAKYGVIGLGALLFLFFMRRNLKRREREVFGGQPTWLRELETPRPLAALAAGADEDPTDRSSGCAHQSTCPSARSRSWSSATPIAWPSRSAPG